MLPSIWYAGENSMEKKNYKTEETMGMEKELAALVCSTKMRPPLQLPAKEVARAKTFDKTPGCAQLNKEEIL